MNTQSQQSIFTGTILAALAVALGAFGTHALRPLVEAHYFEVFETGVRYQMYHALALILLGLTIQVKPLPKIIYTLFLAGIIIFSVSLYGIVLGSLSEINPVRWLGAITPFGGASLIAAWIIFAYNIIKK
jgi:uncharacterized membrane protein YgdD (TMEM256/DUF423 family)